MRRWKYRPRRTIACARNGWEGKQCCTPFQGVVNYRKKRGAIVGDKKPGLGVASVAFMWVVSVLILFLWVLPQVMLGTAGLHTVLFVIASIIACPVIINPIRRRFGRAVILVIPLTACLLVVGQFQTNEKAKIRQAEMEAALAARSENLALQTTLEPSAKPYSLTDETDEADGLVVYITGKLKNNGKNDWTYASVKYALYDSAGNKVGTAADNISGLAAGETWAFKAAITDKSAASYSLDKVTYY